MKDQPTAITPTIAMIINERTCKLRPNYRQAERSAALRQATLALLRPQIGSRGRAAAQRAPWMVRMACPFHPAHSGQRMGPCLYPICWIGEGEACIDKHMAASSRFVAPSPLTLVAVVAAIVGISLSIHVVMLQVLWVPYPDTSRIGRLGLFYSLAQSLGLVALAAALLPWLRRFHPAARGPIVGLLFATMNGVLRNALMAGFATTDFRGSVGGFVQQGLFDLLLGTLAFAVVLLVRSTAVRLAAAVILAGVGTFWLNPALASLLGPLLAWSARHVRPDVYVVPYGANILVPSYLLFAETVIACLLARYVIMLRPAAWDPHGLFRYVGLVLLVRGVWVMMFVWGPIIGMLSVSQFFFQDLVMVLLIQLAWRRLGGHSASDARH